MFKLTSGKRSTKLKQTHRNPIQCTGDYNFIGVVASIYRAISVFNSNCNILDTAPIRNEVVTFILA